MVEIFSDADECRDALEWSLRFPAAWNESDGIGGDEQDGATVYLEMDRGLDKFFFPGEVWPSHFPMVRLIDDGESVLVAKFRLEDLVSEAIDLESPCDGDGLAPGANPAGLMG